MKKIYFVRHGESEGNVGAVQQTGAASLTPHGRTQARHIATRMAKLPIDIIISSTMNRAQETAQFVSQKINKSIEFSDLFVERRRPNEQIGKLKNDPVALESGKLIKDNFTIPDYRYSDEENFADLKERARNALDFLALRSEENILVVTHGFIMRIVMAQVVFGNSLTAKECEQFIRTFHMANTGITVLGYNKNQENPWWVWVWNDHAHLAELED